MALHGLSRAAGGHVAIRLGIVLAGIAIGMIEVARDQEDIMCGAIGKLTLWSVDEGRITSDGQAALKAGDVRHIAIANPDLAPYGVAARETLQSLELLDFLKPKIVMGQNIGQTHSMVATGNAQLGFVALSAVLSPREKSKGSRWDVPQNLFTPIRQDAVLLNAGAKNEAAIAFMKFLKTPDARTVIERYGYGIE